MMDGRGRPKDGSGTVDGRVGTLKFCNFAFRPSSFAIITTTEFIKAGFGSLGFWLVILVSTHRLLLQTRQTQRMRGNVSIKHP